LAGFSRYYRKAHNGFLRLAVRHLYRAPLGKGAGYRKRGDLILGVVFILNNSGDKFIN
jgi:hypothetical protein